MTKVIIEEKLKTSMGIVLKIKNDKIFILGEIISTYDGNYAIEHINFSSKPTEDEYVYLQVKPL